MSDNKKYGKTEFIRFIMSSVEHSSSNNEISKEYLSSQGLDVDKMVSEGIKRIKRVQMRVEADKTRKEMIQTNTARQKAVEWVESILANTHFSLTSLIREEELSLSFRNMESLSQEDVKDILVKHFTLKFSKEQGEKNNEF